MFEQIKYLIQDLKNLITCTPNTVVNPDYQLQVIRESLINTMEITMELVKRIEILEEKVK